MIKTEFRYVVLWVFLSGIIIIVFLQVISGYNIKRLIQGNNSVFNELQIQNTLRKLESDLLTLESDSRGVVVINNNENLQLIEQRLHTIVNELSNFQATLKKEEPASEINRLEKLVSEKIAFSRLILDTYKTAGREEAKKLINTGRGIDIRDSITQLLNIRQSKLRTIVQSIGETGKNARIWGVVITGIALIAVILAFWYITNQGRSQQRMIQALNESEKRSKDLVHMKEQFLANMSHEIRTPMNAILGFTNLLRRTELKNVQKEYVQNIHSAGENLLSLVNDILDLSKIEAGMMHLEETRFSLRSMVSSVGAMFIEKIREKGLQFKAEVNEDVPDIVFGDAVRLTQIFVNLISNAVKFTEKGTILVRILQVTQTEQMVQLKIIVSDTGIGIPVEKQAHIFERFHQAEAETTRRYGGTGLGLSIVKQLVALQNGNIELKSVPGKGSEFIIGLEYKLPDLAQMFSDALSGREEQVSLQKIKILIAEDNAMNQLLVSHLMKSWSIDHKIVNNGNEVINELKKNEYSLILMDIQMPEIDGYTTTGIIRNELKLSIPVIAMTAHAMIGEKEKCLQIGMNDYISKPIKETILYNMIARYAQMLPEKQAVNNHINLDYLHQLSGNDRNFEREILLQFVEQTPDELNQLAEGIESGNYNNIRKTAHSLKSTVGYVGLGDFLHTYLDNLESEAMNGQNINMISDYNEVEQYCRQALEEVKLLLDNGLV